MYTQTWCTYTSIHIYTHAHINAHEYTYTRKHTKMVFKIIKVFTSVTPSLKNKNSLPINITVPLSPTHPHAFLSTVATIRNVFFFSILFGILIFYTFENFIYEHRITSFIALPHSTSSNLFPTPSRIHSLYLCNY